MKYKRILFVISCVLLINSAFSQSLNINDIQYLHSTIGIFLSDNEKFLERKRPSEFILCLITIDSMGSVNNINLIGDDKNKDSIYSFLTRLTPSHFGNWKANKCKGKIIIIPILSLGEESGPQYIKALKELYPLKQIKVENETKKTITITAFQYFVPVSKT